MKHELISLQLVIFLFYIHNRVYFVDIIVIVIDIGYISGDIFGKNFTEIYLFLLPSFFCWLINPFSGLFFLFIW